MLSISSIFPSTHWIVQCTILVNVRFWILTTWFSYGREKCRFIFLTTILDDKSRRVSFQIAQNTNQSLPATSNSSIPKYQRLQGSMANQESSDISSALGPDAVLCCYMVCMNLSPFYIFYHCWPVDDISSTSLCSLYTNP